MLVTHNLSVRLLHLLLTESTENDGKNKTSSNLYVEIDNEFPLPVEITVFYTCHTVKLLNLNSLSLFV